jgi:ABC-type transporter Mla subunit MlaD
MRIKRFYEDIENNNDISKERVSEIIEDLRLHVSEVNSKKEYFDSLLVELNNFKSKSVKSNDQIDDSVVTLDLIVDDLKSTIDSIDNVINNLANYVENGREYLYTEKKES